MSVQPERQLLSLSLALLAANSTLFLFYSNCRGSAYSSHQGKCDLESTVLHVHVQPNYIYIYTNIVIKTLKDIGMVVPKIRETRDCRGWHTIVIPCVTSPYIFIGMELGMVLLLYAIIPCLAAYMYIQSLVSLSFGTTIPTSFNVLIKMFLHLFHWFFIVCSYINAKPVKLVPFLYIFIMAHCFCCTYIVDTGVIV